ncbi:MAG: hypothetical protein ACSHXH_10960 [Marivita sp.]|uniref:hypothetical protein n=1 Tax=Marivita sp. TaxID=2003365 RepID=UPI003EF751B4
MTSTPASASQTPTAEEALRILNEAWAYYTPLPKLVTERNSQPSPVFDEYYAA